MDSIVIFSIGLIHEKFWWSMSLSGMDAGAGSVIFINLPIFCQIFL